MRTKNLSPADDRSSRLLQHGSTPLLLLDSEGVISLSNGATERLLGRHDLEGTKLSELLPEGERESLAERLEAADGERFETAWLDTDNRAVALELRIAPSGDDGERVVEAKDMRARRAALADLTSAEARYRSLFETTRDAICIGTLDGRLLDVNPAAIRLFEYDSREEMLRLDIARDLYWNPADRARAQALFLEQGYVDDIELELRSKDGRRMRIKESATAIYDEAGKIVGFRGILRDVTEKRRLEEQLRQSQKMEAVGRLAGGVAHDFNNLLTAINGYSELALARLGPDDSMRQAIDEIRKAGKRATDLTRRLLTLSRHQTAEPRRIDLNRSVLDMEKLLQRVLGEDIAFSHSLEDDLPRIFADQGQIEQIILNLAVNARDAMPDGGSLELATRRITTPHDDPTLPATPKAGDYALLTVADTGLGMERTVREHAFEPFFTTKGAGHNSGLGLAIVYGIVQQTGGSIAVDSTEGQGSTFYLFFPLGEAQQPVSTKAPVGSSDPLPRGDEHVLLVEDETSVRTLVRQILELQGYTVSAARSTDHALSLCDEMDAPPDLLLTDVVMPGRSGLSLADDLEERYPGLKILFMSGYTDSHTGVRRLTEKHAHFLAKPFTPEALARKARAVLDS